MNSRSKITPAAISSVVVPPGIEAASDVNEASGLLIAVVVVAGLSVPVAVC